MSMLGRLYSHLGELLQLEHLELAALAKQDPQVIIPNSPAFKYATFLDSYHWANHLRKGRGSCIIWEGCESWKS